MAALFNDTFFHERITNLRELGIGFDGRILASDGSIDVHFPYLAACNDFLYIKLTKLMKDGETDLCLDTTPVRGLETIVKYCYKGGVLLTEDNFATTIDAAFALEFKEVIEYCVAFADSHGRREKLWAKFMDVAFKYKFCTLPEGYSSDLILGCVHVIPESVFFKHVPLSQLGDILQCAVTNKSGRNLLIDLLFARFIRDIDSGATNQTTKWSVLLKDFNSNEFWHLPEMGEASLVRAMEFGMTEDMAGLLQVCAARVPETWPLGTHVRLALQCLQHAAAWRPEQASSLKTYVTRSLMLIQPRDLAEDDLHAILSADWVTVPEYQLFKFTSKWLAHHDVTDDVTVKLVGLIRFGLMTEAEVFSLMSEHMHDMRTCTELIVRVMRYHGNPHAQPLCVSPLNRMRVEEPVLYVTGGLDADFDLHGTVMRSAVPGDVTSLAAVSRVPEVVDSCAGAVVNDFLFTCGGGLREEQRCVTSLWRYDPRVSVWLSLAPMSAPRKLHTLTAARQGELVAAGGFDGAHELYTTEVYDVGSDTWRRGPELPHSSSLHAACAAGGAVYVSGGTAGRLLLRCLAPGAEGAEWERLAPMLHPRQVHCLVPLASRLFAVGGGHIQGDNFGFVSSAESYDIAADQWTAVASPARPCSMASAVVCGSSILVLGGMANLPEDTVQRYDAGTDEWHVSEYCLPCGLAAAVAFLVSP